MDRIAPIVFLLDVDNTLLDNDIIIADLKRHLTETFGAACQANYWRHFEQLRRELGYADYLGALQRYRVDSQPDPSILGISSFLLRYPFSERVYPGALALIAHLASWGPTVILSDGDVVFQPWKVECSGLRAAVGGRVLIYVHKEKELADVERRYPAEHYVLVDDKLRIHAAVKAIWKRRVTTVFVRQGHYAVDPEVLRTYPPADIGIEKLGDLLGYEREALAAPHS